METGAVNALLPAVPRVAARTYSVPGGGFGTTWTAPLPSSSFHSAGFVGSVLISTQVAFIPGARCTWMRRVAVLGSCLRSIETGIAKGYFVLPLTAGRPR